jgi:O-antigen biosynthesis protein
MESPTGDPMALCITGMGRSGTSLISSLLQSGGLDIGRRLMGVGIGNVKGHFEDLDFYEFHIWVLESQGIHPSGFTVQPDIQVREEHLLRARELVRERRRCPGPWGWKDPRTTLFLDFWQQQIPEANFLFVYRPPWDVVDSLFRRGDELFRSNPSFAVRVWVHYNRRLLAFHDRFPARCLCVHSYRAAQSPALLLEALSHKFGLELGPAGNLYDESLLHHGGSTRWASLLQHHFPEAVDLYEELNERARNGPSTAPHWRERPDNLCPSRTGRSRTGSAFASWKAGIAKGGRCWSSRRRS